MQPQHQKKKQITMTRLLNYHALVTSDHFWEAKCSTLKACKTILFNSRCLKLWKRVFGKVNFNTKEKQIPLHRHLIAKLDDRCFCHVDASCLIV